MTIMNENLEQDAQHHLAFLYGEETADHLWPQLQARLANFRRHHPHRTTGAAGARFSQRDAILITYGDMVRQDGVSPLTTLTDFLHATVSGFISAVHLLPFYPYSSDDGFAVIDYKAVDPALGTWEDIGRLVRYFQLMFDAVINHISAESAWFQAFRRDELPYRNYFIVVEPVADLSKVFRPRALPLLTPVETAAGVKHVWTTFSADQIDLNFSNPDVLLEIIDTLLFYVAQGAELIRLDAIGFMWKEIGTPCIHLPQTHRIIQLMRTVLDMVAPQVALITETNVPHQENISYFGDGTNEAQMVYNFSLPPLTLHAFHTGNAEVLSQWAATLELPSDQVTFFNFLASHDGIGLTPARGLLPETAIEAMAERVQALGGYVSYKNNPDGTQSAYELNVNYLDALGDPGKPEEPVALIARRFLAAQAIMLALRGVPGIYFHSLFGSRNWREGVAQSGRLRTINREKLPRRRLEQELADPHALRHHVFQGYQALLRARTAEPAFHPNGEQTVVFADPVLFALWRRSPDGRSRVLCLHNVTAAAQAVALSVDGAHFRDLLTGQRYEAVNGTLRLETPPYGALWLKVEG